jgi:hypothetical protein
MPTLRQLSFFVQDRGLSQCFWFIQRGVGLAVRKTFHASHNKPFANGLFNVIVLNPLNQKKQYLDRCNVRFKIGNCDNGSLYLHI